MTMKGTIGRNSIWDKEKIAMVRKGRLEEGLSYSAIALRLQKEFGPRYTKNACVSIGMRNGLSNGPRVPAVKKTKPKPFTVVRFKKPLPQRVIKPTMDEPKPIGPQSDFSDENTCQFIHGFPSSGKWQMCGHPQRNQRLYCEYHHYVVYNQAATEQSNQRGIEAMGKRTKTSSVRFRSI